MPPKKAITADVASEIKPEDAIWLFKCLQHSTTDTAVCSVHDPTLSPAVYLVY